MPKKNRKSTKKIPDEIMSNAIHITNAFSFKPDRALQVINSGLLGYEVKADGEIKRDKDNKKIPLTISRSTYYTNQEKFSEMPQYYKMMKDFAMEGFTKLAAGFQVELKYLHAMAGEILISEKDNMNKLKAIDVLVSKVIPTQSAFADILKDQIEMNPQMMEKSESKENEPSST